MSVLRDENRAAYGDPVHTLEAGFGDDTSLVTAIVSAIEEVSPHDLDPIVRQVDVVALENLLESAERGSYLQVQFDVSCYRVFVRNDGRIEVSIVQQFCIQCGDSLGGGDWHPAVTDADEGGEVTYHLFCDADCKAAWQASG